ncbi:34135_t:CDS:2, partial [Racocetra persica]
MYPNTITAEIGQDIPRTIGFGLAVLLPVSIGTRSIRWTPSKYFIDSIGFTLILGPLITMLPIAYLTGFYADHGAPPLSSSVHMKELKERKRSGDYDVEWKLKMISRATKNLSVIAATFVITNGSYTILAFTYGLWQHNITIFIAEIDIFYLIIWYFPFPILLSIAQAVFIYNTYNPTPNGPTFAHISTTSSTLNNGDSLSNNDKKMEFGLIIKTLDDCKYLSTVRNKQSLDSFNSKSTVISSDPTLQGSKFNEDCIAEYKVNYSGVDALYKDNYDEHGVSFTINNVSMPKNPEPSWQI